MLVSTGTFARFFRTFMPAGEGKEGGRGKGREGGNEERKDHPG